MTFNSSINRVWTRVRAIGGDDDAEDKSSIKHPITAGCSEERGMTRQGRQASKGGKTNRLNVFLLPYEYVWVYPATVGTLRNQFSADVWEYCCLALNVDVSPTALNIS